MPSLPEGPHLDRLRAALRIEAEGQRALLNGDDAGATPLMARAARLYRESWDLATPESYGRLVGMLKAAVLAGDATAEAEYVVAALGDRPVTSPAAAYALAIAALVQGDDPAAARAAAVMREASPAFGRAADAIAALTARDAPAYDAAIRAIVSDFEGRDEHLTGVRIADTALMLERLARPRGLGAHVASPMLP